MPFWLLVIVTIIYAYVALCFLWKQDAAMAIVYTGYAFANVGLILAMPT